MHLYLFLIFKEQRAKWQKEKDNLSRDFGRLVEEKKKLDKNKVEYSEIEKKIFFESGKFRTLTNIIAPPPDPNHDPSPDFDPANDYAMESDNESESAPPERKRGRHDVEKPLTEFSDTSIKKKTDKALQDLVKEWSDLNVKTPIPFDKFVAKLLMRFYFNTGGEYLDKSKGEMFKKVVTLMEFILSHNSNICGLPFVFLLTFTLSSGYFSWQHRKEISTFNLEMTCTRANG